MKPNNQVSTKATLFIVYLVAMLLAFVFQTFMGEPGGDRTLYVTFTAAITFAIGAVLVVRDV